VKKFFIIIGWEFWRHLKSRSFILSTFVSPLFFAAIILIPTFFMSDEASHSPKVFGGVEFGQSQYCDALIQQLEKNQTQTGIPDILLIKITADTSQELKEYFSELEMLKGKLDSLNDMYNKIKERRKYIFQRPKSRIRDRLLRQTYEQLRSTREERDLTEIEYGNMKALTDSLLRVEVVQKADSLLKEQVIEGYLLIKPEEFLEGSVEFHSILPTNFLRIERLKEALQLMVIEQRMQKDGITPTKIDEWLKPFQIKEYQLEGGRKTEFNFMVNYLGPIIVVLFLFISIFTSSGFLFNGILAEKSNRVLEILISSTRSMQLIAGKIFGLGFLGLFQIFIWIVLTLVLVFFNIIPMQDITFLSLRNAGLFVLYFSLGYLFFAAIFVGLGSLLSSEEDAHHLNQFMRILSIFPIALAILVLQSPNALLVRILSFIPFLTPTFMILRIPLGQPPAMDYYISIGIMVFSILISIFFAARIFRIGSLLYGKKPTFKLIWKLLRQG